LHAAAGAQALPDDCKLRIGTNLGGLTDYGTELPFVNLMHNCRTWYSKDVGNPSGGPFDSGHADSIIYRPDGYPTHLPQTLPGVAFPQTVATIWAVTDGWPVGKYTVLFEGTGSLSFWGGLSNLQQTSSNRLSFDFLQPLGGVLEMRILSSAAADPVRNIRVLMPGTEFTYQSQPFNPVWLKKLADFQSVRFMDWFATNNWGQPDPWGSWDDPSLFEWSQRQQLDHYTWATPKGIPYEMAIRLMNDYDLDGWVCVPHRASDDYIRQMATLFHQQLEPERHLTVEYSNETWNWIFGQAQWLLKYGCVQKGLPWPEGTVPYMQNCLDIWTGVYGPHVQRLTRVVGVQTGWQDVSNRTVFNMKPGTLDAFGCTYYFGLSEEADAALDALGAQATAADIAYWARKSRENEKHWIRTQQQDISLPLQLPMVFYEGGQHLTPHPFGQEPTYAQALLDIQRDTAMYNLYSEWYDFVRTLQSGPEPLQLMNFSFVGNRSARYGSWGILERMDQDLSQLPAPKYRATLEQIARYRAAGCGTSGSADLPDALPLRICPNPASEGFSIESPSAWTEARLYDGLGRRVARYLPGQPTGLQGLPAGLYWVEVLGEKSGQRFYGRLLKQ
ncbi:MAG TPA: hypothetical protein PK971_06035, partial [Saprospiraceae bacterium]|nr:hypothetical protein [Saprospiraceae bacterium]